MAGTNVKGVTVAQEPVALNRGIRVYRFAWTADGSGDVEYIMGAELDGVLELLRTVPGADAAQPDDNYDVTLENEDGVDVLQGAGANRDETNAEEVVPLLAHQTLGVTDAWLKVPVAGLHTLKVAHAGALNKGTVVVLVRRVE